MRAVRAVRTARQCVHSINLAPVAAIGRGCLNGANHAQNCHVRCSAKTHALRPHDPGWSEHVSTMAMCRIFLKQINFRISAARSLPNSNTDDIFCICSEANPLPNGELSMKAPSLLMIAAVCVAASASVAHARSAYDGSWDLVFVTQRGACDPSYNFTVNISNGVVTHPNLVRFRGYVAKSGSVRASVTVHEKFASGTGRLFGTSGRGRWSGREGSARCSGYWTAQRN
jgi:hypothetical protein